jgi:hypothetical protein
MANSDPKEAEAARRAEKVQLEVGHPNEHWDALKERVQGHVIKQFSDVAEEWLEVMWCLDAYRVAQAAPEGMGKIDQPWDKRLDSAYRGKGNWFSTLLSLLLDNRTGEKLRSRGRIKGFSQNHQIDLAWPDRKVAPVICAESKVTGAPAFEGTPPRGALDDWSNRRKEMKFSATDLKLARRKQTEDIGHWHTWRREALPKCFMLWAARLSGGDKIEAMIKEAEAVVATYLDGAGIAAWKEKESGLGYELVDHPITTPGLQVVELDDALWQIESEIKRAKQRGLDKDPAELAAPIDPDRLAADSSD